MKYKLTYIEQQIKTIKDNYPQYYNHILTGKELSNFIMLLIEKYSRSINKNSIYKESKELVTGEFFQKYSRDIIYNNLNEKELKEYASTFERHTENVFLNDLYDISCTRQIRYMPGQWHYESYFTIYVPRDGTCPIYLKNGEIINIEKGNIMIVAPYVEHSTPCYKDDQYLEYFLVRSSSFDKVFWSQLNSTTIMSHFFREALKKSDNNSNSYLLFKTNNDKDIYDLIEQIKEEISLKQNYSSQLINSLMSVLFCLLLRRYEDSVILPTVNNIKWKVEFTKIFSHIQNNYATTSLQETAYVCGYSTKQVGRIIQHYFKMNYTEMLTFIKMEKAVELLKENVLSTEEIATTLGYSDLSSFYRAFKKYYRETPIDYINNF